MQGVVYTTRSQHDPTRAGVLYAHTTRRRFIVHSVWLMCLGPVRVKECQYRYGLVVNAHTTAAGEGARAGDKGTTGAFGGAAVR